MTITFALSHQIIKRTDSMVLASGSKNYVTAQFDLLTEDWAAPITAIFNEYTVVLDENNQCLVPWEVLANPGKVAVSAFCGDLHTATSVLVPVYPGGYVAGETPQPPTPDVYQQLIEIAKNAEDVANSVREDADAGKFNGAIGPVGPEGPQGQDAPQIDDTQASPEHPWSGAKVATELGKYAPLESAMTVSGIGSDMASLSPTIAWKMQGLKLFGRTTQDGTPTPETSVPLMSAGDSGSIKVSVVSKNIFDITAPAISATKDGITFSRNDEGSFSIQGTATSNVTNSIGYAGDGSIISDVFKKGGRFVLSCDKATYDASTFNCSIAYKYDGSTKYIPANGVPVDVPKGAEYYNTTIYVPSGATVKTIDHGHLQLEYGGMVTDYAPYTEQDVTVSIPNGIPGIPVDSGGNFTDETGQQWVCDEIDFARGVYVKRVYQHTITGMENWSPYDSGINIGLNLTSAGLPDPHIARENISNNISPAMSNIATITSQNNLSGYVFAISKWTSNFLYFPAQNYGENAAGFKALAKNAYDSGSPWVFIYALNTPIETKLSEEELEAYAALTSYNGTTNVIAQSCGVDAKALANPDEYIKGLIQRIAALEQNAIGG